MIFPLWDGDKRKKEESPPPPQPGMIEMLLFWLLCTTARPAGYFLSGKIRKFQPSKKHGGKKKDVTQVASLSSPFF